MHFYINCVFVGIRIFQRLNLLLVRFDLSVMRSKPQNAYFLTNLHLVLDFCIFKPARLCSICNDAE